MNLEKTRFACMTRQMRLIFILLLLRYIDICTWRKYFIFLQSIYILIYVYHKIEIYALGGLLISQHLKERRMISRKNKPVYSYSMEVEHTQKDSSFEWK